MCGSRGTPGGRWPTHRLSHGVDNRPLVQNTRSETMHERDEERPDVGHLDNDCEVGGQVPTLRNGGDDQRQLHPHPVNGNP